MGQESHPKSSKGPHRQWNEEKNETKVTIPYIKGTINILVKILKRKEIKVTFLPPNSIGRMLDSSKYPMGRKNQKGVYTTPLLRGNTYIGETWHSNQETPKEHCAEGCWIHPKTPWVERTKRVSILLLYCVEILILEKHGTQFKKHQKNIVYNSYKFFSLAEHAHISNHHICIKYAKLFAKEDHYMRRKIHEPSKIEEISII